MTSRRVFWRSLAASLTLFCVACSSARPVVKERVPSDSRELSRSALLIQEMPDGQVRHEWKRLEDVDLKQVQHPTRPMNPRRGIVRISSTGLDEYCEGRRVQCEGDCLASSRPVWVGHWRYDAIKVQPWREARKWWCPEHCMKQADMCRRRMGPWAEDYSAAFDSAEPAIDWVKNHREELLAGAVVVIAGVAFAAVVTASGGGVLVLVPLVLFAQTQRQDPSSSSAWICSDGHP